MKSRRFFVFVCLALIISFLWAGTVIAFAHAQMLDVFYDACDENLNGAGLNETWYILNYKGECAHLDHNQTTIKYYFSEYTKSAPFKTWAALIQETSSISITIGEAEQLAIEIKNAFADSMKKWDNVYIYTCDSTGNIIKNKPINIIQVDNEDEANLTIYPAININGVASTSRYGISVPVQTGLVSHSHYAFWTMSVNIEYFYEHHNFGNILDDTDDKYYDPDSVRLVREAAGAHELGHVLGLMDLDDGNLCGSSTTLQHHLEAIMGYGQPISNRSSNISYRDIAGVAITRGFHADNDHVWLYAGQQSTGQYKLICSICNGIKSVSSLSGYSYYNYGCCNNDHSLSSENMMPVASYGTKDYYKCKYCRYVAPFDDIVEQNYVYSSVSSTQHQCTNEVDGLRYSFLEAHTYGRYFTPNNKLFHNSHCDCGQPITQRHVISPNDVGQTNQWCKYCGELLIGSGTLNGVYTDYPHTENGSYILPSGIIVLVPEDEEAYLNGTLEFRTGEIM